MIQRKATINPLFNTSSPVLIKLIATNRTYLSTKLLEVDIVDTNLQIGLYTDQQNNSKDHKFSYKTK